MLKEEPDWTQLPTDLPRAIRTLVQRCLVKDRRQRVADIAVAQFVLTQPVAIIPDAATLSQAKQAMDAIPYCQDAFVTHEGSPNNPVLGRITNVVIEANSKV